MFSLFVTLSLRYVRFYRWRSLLIILSIALGVATWIATETLQRALKKSVLSSANPTSGAADLSVTNDGAKGVPRFRNVNGQKIPLENLLQVPGVDQVHPRIIANVNVLSPKLEHHSARIFGIQLSEDKSSGLNMDALNIRVSAADVNSFLGIRALRPILGLPDPPALVGAKLAKTLGLTEQGQFLTLAHGSQKKQIYFSGVIRGTGNASLLSGNAVVLHLDDAADLLGEPEKVTRFDLTLQPGANVKQVQTDLQGKIDGLARVQTPEMQKQRVEDLILGLEIGFKICGAGALVVGMFLVYNALSVSVMERRREIGILRSVGATRAQVRLLFVSEAMLLGTLGTALGIPMGIGLADLSFEWVRELYQGLYVRLEGGETDTPISTIVSAIVVGLLTALFAVLLPASQAAAEEPADTVRRAPQVKGRAYRFLQIGGAVTFFALGALLMMLKPNLSSEHVELTSQVMLTVGVMALLVAWLSQRLGGLAAWLLTLGVLLFFLGSAGWILRSEQLTSSETSYAGFALLVLSMMLATPWLSLLVTRSFQPVARAILPLPSRLAADNLVRSPGRTGLVIAALAAGVALTVQTAGVIVSNERALLDWLDRAQHADLVITSGAPISATTSLTPLSTKARTALKADNALPEGSTLIGSCYRHPDYDSATRGPTKIFLTLLEADAYYKARKKRSGPSPELELYRRLAKEDNSVIVSDNFARTHQVKVGDEIRLEGGPDRYVRLKVIGQLEEYQWVRGSLIVDLKRQQEMGSFGVSASLGNRKNYDAFEIYLPEGTSPGTIKEALEGTELASRYHLWVQTKDELKQDRRNGLRRIYGAAYAQQLLVGMVAVLGVITALLISILGRRRELGLLRAIGATRGQMVQSIIAEALLLGIVGTLLGFGVGLMLENYVVHVILYDQTGYEFAAVFPWMETAIIAGIAIVMSSLAGLGPALYHVNMSVTEAIAYE